ncbi:MAG: CPBP family intramembrane metalloprotease [Acidobacteriia bacterium]|nr:CPBP family intramembrane metalloprotease [Terriglobia bacterium]
MSEADSLLPEPMPEQAGEDTYPFWTYHDLALFIGAALPSMLVALLAVRGLRYFMPMQGKAMEVLLVQFTGYGFLFLSLFALLKVRYGRPFWGSLHWRAASRSVGTCLMAGPLLAMAVGWTGILLGGPDVDMPMMDLLSDRRSIFWIGAFAVTLGPLCEELAFRGFLQPLVSRSIGPAAGIILAAVPFALMHGPQYGWSWRHVALVGLAGIAFGWVRHKTGSTAASTAMHATYNFTFFAGFVLSRGDLFRTW